MRFMFVLAISMTVSLIIVWLAIVSAERITGWNALAHARALLLCGGLVVWSLVGAVAFSLSGLRTGHLVAELFFS